MLWYTEFMYCPVCRHKDTEVIDSRTTAENNIRRRRECVQCKFRFSTYEQIEIGNIEVVKKDGTTEPYKKEKLESGIKKALEKRPVNQASYSRFIINIEEEVMRRATRATNQKGAGTIDSQIIGSIIMEGLRGLDEVAYIRFASVYRAFQDVEGFKVQIEELKSQK